MQATTVTVLASSASDECGKPASVPKLLTVRCLSRKTSIE
jgi:hypothetical protein